MVDKELGCPLRFTAVPPSLGLQAFIDNKRHNINQIQKNLKKFSSEFESNQEPNHEREYKITSIEGRKRIITKIRQQHDAAKSSVDILTSLPRFLYIAYQCMENYNKAIERGVKYRIILGIPNDSQDLPTEMEKAHNNDKTTIKKFVGYPQQNTVIFDREQMNFSYYPDRRFADSPLILTNHPCMVGFALNSFQKMWESL